MYVCFCCFFGELPLLLPIPCDSINKMLNFPQCDLLLWLSNDEWQNNTTATTIFNDESNWIIVPFWNLSYVLVNKWTKYTSEKTTHFSIWQQLNPEKIFASNYLCSWNLSVCVCVSIFPIPDKTTTTFFGCERSVCRWWCDRSWFALWNFLFILLIRPLHTHPHAHE